MIEDETNKYTIDNIIHNSRIMVPLRIVSELLGCIVEWDDENQTVRIITR